MSISGFYGKDQTKNLVKLLSDQIILDKKLRDAKEQYDNLRKEYPEFKEVQAEIMKGIEKMDPVQYLAK